MTTLATAATLATSAMAQNFTLHSNELGGQLTDKHFLNGMGFKGENVSPQLSWKDAPAGTKSFAVTMYDMDAPTGSGFWHWVVFNIPADVHELKSGAGNADGKMIPAGAIQSNTDFGAPGFVGAAPPPGPAHRYLITVYALSQKLELDKNATPAYVGFNMAGMTLGKASLLVYGQNKG